MASSRILASDWPALFLNMNLSDMIQKMNPLYSCHGLGFSPEVGCLPLGFTAAVPGCGSDSSLAAYVKLWMKFGWSDSQGA